MPDAPAFSSCSRTARPRSPPRRQSRPDWNEPSTAPCNTARSNHQSRRIQKQQRPLRRDRGLLLRSTARPWQSLTVLMWATLVALLFCCPGAEAQYTQMAKPLEKRTPLLFDRSEPPIPAPRVRLEKRQEQESLSATPSFIPAPTVAGQASSSLFGIQTATASPRDDLPSPFDTSLGNNFTSPSCPAFFQNFLTNSSFQECLPFSLLLQTSNAFFTTTRSPVRLTQTLEATCNVPSLPKCVAIMSDLATRIQMTEHCGADYQMENPMVRQAYAGFVAYQPLYLAGCLTDNNGDYCFAKAVGNASNPAAAYIYYLPLGMALPVSATANRVGCDGCLRNTMAVFALYANDEAQLLSQTYDAAAEQLDSSCGSRFVEAAKASTNAVSPVRTAGTGLLVTLFMMFLLVV